MLLHPAGGPFPSGDGAELKMPREIGRQLRMKKPGEALGFIKVGSKAGAGHLVDEATLGLRAMRWQTS